jgi:hypothetical protein
MRADRAMRRSRASYFPFVIACGSGVAAGLTVVTACITVPPADLPQVPTHGPTIVHDAVVPPYTEILAELPNEFVVPVQLDQANASFEWDVFVDYDPVGSSEPQLRQDDNESPADGGVSLVNFQLSSSLAVLDPSQCHVIQFLVAHAFNENSPYTWDSVGGDTVSWIYNPGGGPAGCPVYDAGALQDGAFPLVDAPSDGILVVGDP